MKLMQLRCIALFLLLLQVGVAQTPTRQLTKALDPALRQELLDRYRKAKVIREKLRNCSFPCEGDSLWNQLREMDRDNANRIRTIVKDRGWPGSDLVSEDGTVMAMALVIITDNHELDVELLPAVEAAFRAGKTPGSSYAILLDRILVHDGKPQVYGTVWKPKGQRYAKEELAPIQDEVNLDKRRAEVGLPPLRREH